MEDIKTESKNKLILVQKRIEEYFNNSEIFNKYDQSYTYDNVKLELYDVLNEISTLKEEISNFLQNSYCTTNSVNYRHNTKNEKSSITYKQKEVTNMNKRQPKTPMNKTPLRFDRSPTHHITSPLNLNFLTNEKVNSSTDAILRSGLNGAANKKETPDIKNNEIFISRSPTNMNCLKGEQKDSKNNLLAINGGIPTNTNTPVNQTLYINTYANKHKHRQVSPSTMKKSAKISIFKENSSSHDGNKYEKNERSTIKSSHTTIIFQKCPSKRLKSIEINIADDKFEIDLTSSDMPYEKGIESNEIVKDIIKIEDNDDNSLSIIKN